VSALPPALPLMMSSPSYCKKHATFEETPINVILTHFMYICTYIHIEHFNLNWVWWLTCNLHFKEDWFMCIYFFPYVLWWAQIV